MVVCKRIERLFGGVPNKPGLELSQKVKVFLLEVAQNHEIPNLGESKSFKEVGFRIGTEILLFPR